MCLNSRPDFPHKLPHHNTRRHRNIQRMFGAKLGYLQNPVAQSKCFISNTVYLVPKYKSEMFFYGGGKILQPYLLAGLFDGENFVALGF